MALNKYHLSLLNIVNKHEELKNTLNYMVVKEAVDKQIPQKPRLYEDNINYLCPCCDTIVKYGFIGNLCGNASLKYKYCPECGQAIDWTE